MSKPLTDGYAIKEIWFGQAEELAKLAAAEKLRVNHNDSKAHRRMGYPVKELVAQSSR